MSRRSQYIVHTAKGDFSLDERFQVSESVVALVAYNPNALVLPLQVLVSEPEDLESEVWTDLVINSTPVQFDQHNTRLVVSAAGVYRLKPFPLDPASDDLIIRLYEDETLPFHGGFAGASNASDGGAGASTPAVFPSCQTIGVAHAYANDGSGGSTNLNVLHYLDAENANITVHTDEANTSNVHIEYVTNGAWVTNPDVADKGHRLNPGGRLNLNCSDELAGFKFKAVGGSAYVIVEYSK